MVISDALTFMAGDRTHADEAYAGDIMVAQSRVNSNYDTFHTR